MGPESWKAVASAIIGGSLGAWAANELQKALQENVIGLPATAGAEAADVQVQVASESPNIISYRVFRHRMTLRARKGVRNPPAITAFGIAAGSLLALLAYEVAASPARGNRGVD